MFRVIAINTAFVVIHFTMSLYFLCDVGLFLAEVIQYEHTVSGCIDELKSTFICLPPYKILSKIFNLSSVHEIIMLSSAYPVDGI